MILVIGATGTVGRQVAAPEVEAGAEVRAMVRDPGKATFRLGVEVARGDLCDPASLVAPLLGVDAVRAEKYIHAGQQASVGTGHHPA
jgi:uncharacterized protein YbjT (DUF2867 family)